MSEEGNKAKMLKTENFYMQDNSKNMHLVTDELYFIIEEKQNSVELTDRGIDILSHNNSDTGFFILPDVGAKVADIQNDKSLSNEEKDRKERSFDAGFCHQI